MDATDSFGYWVRRRRKALDLTQEDLAQRVGCAVVTLRKIESDQRRPSAQMARRLAYCLALPDAEGPAFVATAVGQRAPARLPRLSGPNLHSPGYHLPAPVTSLAGRTEEIAVIIDALQDQDVRLVTLTGPVGVGKTRLALEVGRRLTGTYRDGVGLVALAAVQDPALAPVATASALGVHEARGSDLTQSILSFLAAKEMLLIFDNLEHLLPVTAFLADLLAACPELRLLTTSRARLHLYGEHEFALAALPLPERNDALDAATSPAVQLFCQRATAARADFQLTPSLTPTVVEICRRLDGLPLAIELAAARLKMLSLQELHARLERPLPLLSQGAASPGRRRGLQEAIAWSYELLPPAERVLLERLSVFSGGFSLAAAEALCQDAPYDAVQVSLHLAALLDHSLLVRQKEEPAARAAVARRCAKCPLRIRRGAVETESRYAMLEIIREFALERLRASGAQAAVQRDHAEYYAAWASHADAQLRGPDQAVWLARLEQESGNLRAALATFLANGAHVQLAAMACSLSAFWRRHGHYSEGRRWLEQALAQMAHSPTPNPLRACTLQAAASLAYRQGDWRQARPWLEESLALYRAADDRLGMARVYFDLGWSAVDREEWAEAALLNQESLRHARAADDRCAMYRALTNLGWARLCVGAWDAAAALFGEAHELAQAAGHVQGVAVSQANLGWIALHQGQPAQAAALARNSLHMCHLLGEREVLAECIEILAAAAMAEGDGGRAAELEAAAAGLWEALRVTRPPTRYATPAAPHQPIAAAPAAAAREGRPMSVDAMVAFALDCGGDPD